MGRVTPGEEANEAVLKDEGHADPGCMFLTAVRDNSDVVYLTSR